MSGINFQHLVLNLDGGTNKNQSEYYRIVQCIKSGSFNCPAAVSGNLKDLLNGALGVGLNVAQIFDISWAA
jgi:hypothetical protein